MSSAAADRNLLFGIVALQMDFVGRDALIAAMHAWVLQKATSLGRILEEQGALSPARRSLLDALVEEHLKLHGDDPRRSLAALSSIGSVREDLSRVADAQIQASLAMVSAARGGPDDPYNTVAAPSLGISTSAGTRFRILRPHARGGLGQVSVALDRELDRPVALKEIQERHADEPESRARFVQEAEITGKLEHPGIVPVYGLGHDATGRPFYAMRFIQGDSLKEAIAAYHADGALGKDPALRSSRLRELLRRFTDVCNAVAYAHSRGVLHRDLKPGNIMLGPYGETLLVDWGLSKPIGTQGGSPAAASADLDPASLSLTDTPIRLSGQSGSRADTVAGSTIGTPAFASPEQLLGRLDLLGPASDVYGLGATLYSLLTGRAPVDSPELEEVLRRVPKGEIPPPRSIDPTIPRPLEAICRRAMAVKPEDRYESARALAEDVKRWMDDAPVAAYRDPVAVRAARWVRRHQRLVAGAAAAVLVGLTALGIAYSRESSINRELRRAKAESDRRLDQTLQAIDDYYTGVSAEVLLGQEEFRELRERLLEKPRQFYEQLARELAASESPDERTRTLLAKGRTGLGMIHQSLARYEEASAQLESANALLRRSADSRPGDARVQAALATNENRLGTVYSFAGDYRAGEVSLQDASKRWKSLLTGDPNNPAYQKGLADNLGTMGTVRQYLGDEAGSAASEREAFRIWTSLVDLHPDVPEYLWGGALCATNLGISLQGIGDWSDAEKAFDGAIGMYSRLMTLKPGVPLYRNGLVHAHTGQGLMREQVGDLARAKDSYRRAIAIGTSLTSAQPNVLLYRDVLARSYNCLGGIQMRTGDPTGGTDAVRQAIEIYEDLTRRNPSSLDYQAGLAASHLKLGGLREQLGESRNAAESFRRAIEVYAKANNRQSNIFLLEGLARSHGELGRMQCRLHEEEAAAESFRRSIRGYEELCRAHPRQMGFAYSLAIQWNELGVFRRQQGRLDAARDSHEQARAILARLVEEQPQSLDNKKIMAGVLTNIGLVDMAQGRRLQGLRRMQEALSYWKEPFANNPKDPYYSAGIKDAPKAFSDLFGSRKPRQPAVPTPPGTRPEPKGP